MGQPQEKHVLESWSGPATITQTLCPEEGGSKKSDTNTLEEPQRTRVEPDIRPWVIVAWCFAFVWIGTVPRYFPLEITNHLSQF